MEKNDYGKWGKKALIEEIRSLKKRKKFGLVWESKPEDVVERCKTELPVLQEVKSLAIPAKEGVPTNILIEGDNYHALSVLNYTHKGKIDFIYIDPPYNTGAKDWKYNNSYVDANDGYRHSKWLSMMSNRINIAKNLLAPDGIIVVTIDDYEIGTMRLLMDECFGEKNRMGLVTIVHNPRGRSDDFYFATSHEYALVYSKTEGKAKTFRLALTDEQVENFDLEDEISCYRLLPLKRTGSNSTPKERPNLLFPIYYYPDSGDISLDKKAGTRPAKILPIDSEGNKRVWRWGKDKVQQDKYTELTVKMGRNGSYSIYAKDRIKGGRKPKTVWVEPKYDASSHGTMLLQKLLGQRGGFNYPKSIYAVKDILEVGLRDKKKAIVLDFFAGSGTTGHAVSILNKEDGGSRRFILCTNNENGIAREVCHPRIKAVIKGHEKYPNITGIPSSLKYYKTDFVPSALTDQNKAKLTDKSAEMLCLREGTYEEVKSSERYVIFRNKARYTGIIYRKSAIVAFKKAAAKFGNVRFVVYVFSLTDEDFTDEFLDMQKVSVKPIPEVILRVYRRIFK